VRPRQTQSEQPREDVRQQIQENARLLEQVRRTNVEAYRHIVGLIRAVGRDR